MTYKRKNSVEPKQNGTKHVKTSTQDNNTLDNLLQGTSTRTLRSTKTATYEPQKSSTNERKKNIESIKMKKTKDLSENFKLLQNINEAQNKLQQLLNQLPPGIFNEKSSGVHQRQQYVGKENTAKNVPDDCDMDKDVTKQKFNNSKGILKTTSKSSQVADAKTNKKDVVEQAENKNVHETGDKSQLCQQHDDGILHNTRDQNQMAYDIKNIAKMVYKLDKKSDMLLKPTNPALAEQSHQQQQINQPHLYSVPSTSSMSNSFPVEQQCTSSHSIMEQVHTFAPQLANLPYSNYGPIIPVNSQQGPPLGFYPNVNTLLQGGALHAFSGYPHRYPVHTPPMLGYHLDSPFSAVPITHELSVNPYLMSSDTSNFIFNTLNPYAAQGINFPF